MGMFSYTTITTMGMGWEWEYGHEMGSQMSLPHISDFKRHYPLLSFSLFCLHL